MTTPDRTGPLGGTTVIDFTRVFSGPFATQILGDLGAEIIKIERVDGGDEARLYGVDDREESPGAPFLAMNRNKKSVALNVTVPAGRAAAERLVERADVLVENFRPTVMDRLGLGYERLSAVNPGLVYCSISGFGSTGPLSGRAANDLSIQAQSGLLSMTGEPGRQPVRTPAPIGDLMAGMYAAIGVLAALAERERTGRGDHVETSMLESQVNALGYFFADYWLRGAVPQPMGTANRLGLPNQAFPTRDGWVCVTAANERAWRRCCAALGIPDAAEDARFRDLSSRYAHRAEVVELLTEATSKLTTEECVARLDEYGVSNAPVQTVAESAAHPQLESMGATVSVPFPGRGRVRLVASPVHFANVPPDEPSSPPLLGQHTSAVLRAAGYSVEEIADLEADGVVGVP